MSRRDQATGAAAAAADPLRGFRPAARRRARMATGAALAAAAVGGNVIVYTSLDDATEVVQMVRSVRAGDMVTADDVRIVEVDLDPTVPHVTGDQIASVVGQYAATYIPAGSLAVPIVLQSDPLVTPGTGIVSIQITGGGVPAGVIERSLVELVIGRGPELVRVTGRIVTRPAPDVAEPVIAVEVPIDQAAVVAAADNIRLVHIPPVDDPTTVNAVGDATVPSDGAGG